MLKLMFAVAFSIFVFCAQALAQVPITVLEGSSYPVGAVPITASAAGTTGAITATLAASTTKTTYICGFSYTGTNPTVATNTSVTVTGTITGTMSFGFPTLAFVATLAHPSPMTQYFFPCVPSSAINTAIAVNGPALGAGALLATVAAWGYQQ